MAIFYVRANVGQDLSTGDGWTAIAGLLFYLIGITVQERDFLFDMHPPELGRRGLTPGLGVIARTGYFQ
ncbi:MULTISPECIES: hypothetical protein [unclassified Cryobacterium]|uniref:hypothetical protein n=1 Tax=unclassified Cryobacterium TaxID=2649013 RepID=UPI0018C9AA8C|nr:hypothetical protein [Cryobacterium sp. CAN_C3]